MFAAYRDVARVLYSMAALDSEAIGGAIERIEEERGRGMARLAGRLAEQGRLRAGIDGRSGGAPALGAHQLRQLRRPLHRPGTAVDEVARLLVETAERSVLAGFEPT